MAMMAAGTIAQSGEQNQSGFSCLFATPSIPKSSIRPRVPVCRNVIEEIFHRLRSSPTDDPVLAVELLQQVDARHQTVGTETRLPPGSVPHGGVQGNRVPRRIPVDGDNDKEMPLGDSRRLGDDLVH